MEHIVMTIFSICVQAAVGIMVFVAIGRLLNKGVFKHAIVTAAGLGIVGMLASFLHLGKPLVAYRALFQFGSSWLSREIWFTALFIGFAAVAALLVLLKSQNKTLITGLASIAALVGLINVFAMASIYSATSVLIWQGTATFVEFYAVTISLGAILFLALSIKETPDMKKHIALTVAAVIILQVITVVAHLIILGGSSSIAVQSSITVLDSMVLATVFQWASILAGAGLVLWIAKDQISKLAMNVVFGSAVLLLVGQLIGRYEFYASIIVGLN